MLAYTNLHNSIFDVNIFKGMFTFSTFDCQLFVCFENDKQNLKYVIKMKESRTCVDFSQNLNS